MVKDVVLEIAVANVAVEAANVEVATHEAVGSKRYHGDDGDTSR